MTYPHTPGHKGADHTGRDAAKAMVPIQRTIKDEVLSILRWNPGGMTADEISDRIADARGMSGMQMVRFRGSVRPRVAELGADGKIVASNFTRENESGMQARVWCVKEARR